jgi:hypothetical protein
MRAHNNTYCYLLGEAELALQQRIPGIDLVESVVMLSTVKRVGWMLNRDSTATGRVIVPAAVARAG